jgi:hypothetical protein
MELSMSPEPVQPLAFVLILLATALLAGCGGGRGSADSFAPGDSLHVSCLQRPDPGPCRGAKEAYFYDYKTDSCRRFVWGGCRGNVPFETLEQCLKLCKGGG